MPLLKLVPDNTNIDFMRWRVVAIILSLVLLALSAFFITTRGLNFGVDFVGGQLIRATFSQPAELDDLRSRLGALGLGEPSIQQFGSPQEVAIRMRCRPAAKRRPMSRPTGCAPRLALSMRVLGSTRLKRFRARLAMSSTARGRWR
jgi:preprotein translocase subunit SecF